MGFWRVDRYSSISAVVRCFGGMAHSWENLSIQLDVMNRTYAGDRLLLSENKDACSHGHARHHFSWASAPQNGARYVLEADKQLSVEIHEVYCVFSAGALLCTAGCLRMSEYTDTHQVACGSSSGSRMTCLSTS